MWFENIDHVTCPITVDGKPDWYPSGTIEGCLWYRVDCDQITIFQISYVDSASWKIGPLNKISLDPSQSVGDVQMFPSGSAYVQVTSHDQSEIWYCVSGVSVQRLGYSSVRSLDREGVVVILSNVEESVLAICGRIVAPIDSSKKPYVPCQDALTILKHVGWSAASIFIERHILYAEHAQLLEGIASVFASTPRSTILNIIKDPTTSPQLARWCVRNFLAASPEPRTPVPAFAISAAADKAVDKLEAPDRRAGDRVRLARQEVERISGLSLAPHYMHCPPTRQADNLALALSIAEVHCRFLHERASKNEEPSWGFTYGRGENSATVSKHVMNRLQRRLYYDLDLLNSFNTGKKWMAETTLKLGHEQVAKAISKLGMKHYCHLQQQPLFIEETCGSARHDRPLIEIDLCMSNCHALLAGYLFNRSMDSSENDIDPHAVIANLWRTEMLCYHMADGETNVNNLTGGFFLALALRNIGSCDERLANLFFLHIKDNMSRHASVARVTAIIDLQRQIRTPRAPRGSIFDQAPFVELCLALLCFQTADERSSNYIFNTAIHTLSAHSPDRPRLASMFVNLALIGTPSLQHFLWTAPVDGRLHFDQGVAQVALGFPAGTSTMDFSELGPLFLSLGILCLSRRDLAHSVFHHLSNTVRHLGRKRSVRCPTNDINTAILCVLGFLLVSHAADELPDSLVNDIQPHFPSIAIQRLVQIMRLYIMAATDPGKRSLEVRDAIDELLVLDRPATTQLFIYWETLTTILIAALNKSHDTSELMLMLRTVRISFSKKCDLLVVRDMEAYYGKTVLFNLCLAAVSRDTWKSNQPHKCPALRILTWLPLIFRSNSDFSLLHPAFHWFLPPVL